MKVGNILPCIVRNVAYPKTDILPLNRFYTQLETDKFVKTSNQALSFKGTSNGIEISSKNFGLIEKTGKVATLYTIKNKNGASIDLSNFGATITAIKVPDKSGRMIDVTQGYTSVGAYETNVIGHPGGTIGPCASKINNGKFILNGETYQLECNKDSGKTHSHGGSNGLDVLPWEAEVLEDGVKFTYLKKDMEIGYPGNVEISVTYKFDNDNNLSIEYNATTDKDTILNLTNHSYFNLDGAANSSENSILGHLVHFPNSSHYTPANEMSIPTGEIASVVNTPFDFRQPKIIEDVMDLGHKELKLTSGFDQNFCINEYDGKTLVEAAKITSPKTGITLSVKTNLPGFQFYTANNLGKPVQPLGKDGLKYEKRSALCIEPQFFPNAINTFDEKPILKAGEMFNRQIVYSFEVN